MITEFNIFEKYWSEEERIMPKLVDTLVSLFQEYGYVPVYPSSYNEYKLHLTRKIDSDVYSFFYLRGTNLGSKTLTINMESEISFVRSLPSYFSTISELKVNYVPGRTQFEVELKGGLEIVDEISKEKFDKHLKEFEIKEKAKKFKLL